MTGKRSRLLWICGCGLVVVMAAGFAVMQLVRGRRDSPFHFVEGVVLPFRHQDGSSGKYCIVEAYASGICLFDYNGDGLEDIYFLNGAPLEGGGQKPPPGNALYRNDGNWTFTDVTAGAGVGHGGFGLGVCAGDFDNDGDLDLYVNNYGPNVLYRNNGDGTFTDVTAAAGVEHNGCGSGCVFLDIEGDGDLDLYVAVYLEFSSRDCYPEFRGDVPLYRPPELYRPAPDVLFRNNGDGTFSDISQEAGIASARSWGMGVIAADYDSDGDTDIFVANDVAANFLWRNDGSGRFEEVALRSGTAFDCNGDEQGSMGVDCADLDNDGLLDFYQTSYSTQMPATFKNLGEGEFIDITPAARSGTGQIGRVTWGCNFGDLDNDGFVDLFVASGHLQDQIDRIGTSTYKQTNLLYRNEGGGRFREVSALSGPGLGVAESSRGSALGDLDNDGDLDIVINNSRTLPTLLRNETDSGNNWIQIITRGVKSNRHGIGAQVFLTVGETRRVAEVHGGRSYQSHYGLRLHFGLGRSSRVDRIEVRWPCGTVDVLRDVRANQILVITEGTSGRGEDRDSGGKE